MLKKMLRLVHIPYVSLLVLISFIETLFLMISESPRKGLEFIWLLPLLFGICVLLFSPILSYPAIGLKLYYAIAVIRYMVQPLLIQLTEGHISATRMSSVEASSYYVSTVLQCIEILIAFSTIFYYYRRMDRKYASRYNEKKLNEKDVVGIRFCGWIVIAIFAFVMLLRINVWLPALTIFGIKESTKSGILLENTLFSVIKTILFIWALSNATRNTGKKKMLWTLLTLACIVFNVMTYFGSNRSLTIEIIVTSVSLTVYYLPTYRKQILATVIPVGVIVVLTMFITKQFGIDTVGNMNSVKLELQYVSNQIEEYTNGPWCIAQTYEASRNLSFVDSFKAVVKEISNALMVVFEIPGLKWMTSYVKGWSSATDIFRAAFQIRNRGQIPSFSAGFFYCYGFLGWLLMPIGNFIAIRILVKYSVKSRYSNVLLERYIFLWTSILFGLTHCYCVRVLLYCVSKYAWFLWLVLIANKVKVKVRIKRRIGE